MFPLLGKDSGEYITREPAGFVNIIKCADAELVDVAPTQPISPVACSEDTYKVALDVFLVLQPGVDVGTVKESVRRLAQEALSVKFGRFSVGIA